MRSGKGSASEPARACLSLCVCMHICVCDHASTQPGFRTRCQIVHLLRPYWARLERMRAAACDGKSESFLRIARFSRT